MALVAVHAVVDISLDALVVLVGLGFRMAIGALENRVVVRVCVTRRAHPIGVAMIDGELRVLRVIKRRVQPVGGAMAIGASRREKLRLCSVSRIRRVVVVGLVTADTCRRQRCVVAVDVAVGTGARRHSMRSGQGERCVVVIEGRR